MESQYIPKVDVIIEVLKWLHFEGWMVNSLSIPTGQKIDSIASKNKVEATLTSLGIEGRNVRFKSDGEDIVATKDDIVWKIECKGFGGDLPAPTVKNHFDRAVASAVSYYNRNQGLRLGIALPEEYMKYIEGKLPKALRTALNLWVFLYVKADEMLLVFAPDEEI